MRNARRDRTIRWNWRAGARLGRAIIGGASAASLTAPAAAQWENLNPGAGGRIQDVVLDPNTPGRAYYLSDMEDVSRTDDHGQTWTYLGHEVAYPNTLTAAVEPGDAQRVYLGSVGGLEVSDDAGETWRRITGIDDPITQIAIPPDRPERIVAVPSDKMRWQHRPWKHETDPFSPRTLYVSEDRGQVWDQRVYDAEPGRRETFTIDIDPTDPDTLYLSGLGGVYRSGDAGATWQRLPQPPGTGDSWGAGLSPDGRTLYAAFQVPDELGNLMRQAGSGAPSQVPTRLYATPTASIHWQEVAGLPEAHQQGEHGRYKQFWMPQVDPRSPGPDEHRLLTASHGDRSGLWQVTATWDGDTLDDSRWERVFYYGNDGQGADFDHGWEQYSTRPLAWRFTPNSWNEDGIWTTGDQTLFRTDRGAADWQQNWESLYTRFVRELDGVRFYRTRGVQCTFVFEGTGDGDYVVQANADNAIKESYDGGHSWTVGIVQPRSNAVTIVRTVEPHIVLAHTSSGYGAASRFGKLWVKRLQHRSPRDTWHQIAGGPDEVGGLPPVQSWIWDAGNGNGFINENACICLTRYAT